MNEDLRTFRLGAATISVINVGDIQGAMTGWMDEPAGGWPAADAARLKQIMKFPIQCIHIGLAGMSVLVDAGLYEMSPNSTYAIPDYQPPPSLLAQLAKSGVRPEQIKQVVVTHAHQDHFNGITLKRHDVYQPCFPNARHYLGRADWERAEMQKALQDPDSVESCTLCVLQREGLLELVVGDRELGDGIQISAAPGETPGHQIVRVQSEGQTLFCVGDLYHHTIEVEQPTLMVRWADANTILASRRALAEAALADDARLVATHIPGIGRLRQDAKGLAWVAS